MREGKGREQLDVHGCVVIAYIRKFPSPFLSNADHAACRLLEILLTSV